jgi:hypothetical protein
LSNHINLICRHGKSNPGIESYLNLEFRHCEERSDEAIHSFFARRDGLLRCARNDGLAIVGCFKIESENCAAVRPRFWWCVDLSGSAKATPDIRYAEISPASPRLRLATWAVFARWDGNQPKLRSSVGWCPGRDRTWRDNGTKTMASPRSSAGVLTAVLARFSIPWWQWFDSKSVHKAECIRVYPGIKTSSGAERF